MNDTDTTDTNINIEPIVKPVVDKRRHFLAVFFLSFMWGIFGVDRFYLGKYWTGILKLLTFGGFGLWLLVDMSMIMSGAMRDKQGNEMLEFARYKKFASRTVLIFTLVFCFTIAIIAAISIYIVMQFLQGDGLQNIQDMLLNGSQIPGVDQLQILYQQ